MLVGVLFDGRIGRLCEVCTSMYSMYAAVHRQIYFSPASNVPILYALPLASYMLRIRCCDTHNFICSPRILPLYIIICLVHITEFNENCTFHSHAEHIQLYRMWYTMCNKISTTTHLTSVSNIESHRFQWISPFGIIISSRLLYKTHRFDCVWV